MNFIFKTAARNVKRNKRRSLLAIISVTLALTLIVFMQGFIGGILDSMVKNTTRNETGHIRISTKKFKEKSKFMSVTENLQEPDKIIGTIMADRSISENIELITERTNFGVLLSNEGNNKTAMAISGDSKKEKDLSMLYKSIKEGRYLENEREMIIGKGLAETLKYKLGDEVKVMTQGADYALHLRKFTIVGIFDTGLKTMDDNFFQIGLKDAQKLLRSDNSVQQIIIMLKDYKDSEKIAGFISMILKNDELSVDTWTKISSNYDYMEMVSGIYNWIYFIIALLGAFIIGNIMTMVVLERRHEIGILKSMGLKGREILMLFLTEGMIMGFLGSLVGTILGIIIISIININGLDLTKMLAGVKNFPVDNVIFFTISISSVMKSLLLGTLISSLVSILPSRRAAKMNVVDSIKVV
ncbi:MAG: ABC transporter permease [Candidatus Delongbacteria bacterium]|nr:ABC transporter permease [Candidatus Delongbacteria bacterium]